MKKFYVFLSALLIFGCASKPATHIEAQSPPVNPAGLAMVQDLHNREIEATKGLIAFQQVAEKATDPKDRVRADEILHMFMERAVVVVPIQNGIWIPPFVDDTDSVRIVPLELSDEKYDFWKKRFMDAPEAASYSPTQRMFVLHSYVKVSPKISGLIWAHEGDHAHTNAKNSYWPKTKQAFCEQERDTHEFQYRLTADIGGASYKKLLQEEVGVMYEMVKNSSKIIGTSFPTLFGYQKALDSVFGPALSDFERDFRNTHLWTDTIFHFIDKYFTGDKERQKAAVLCAIYDELGVQTPK